MIWMLGQMCMCSATVAENTVTTAMAIIGSIHQGNVLGMEIVRDQSVYQGSVMWKRLVGGHVYMRLEAMSIWWSARLDITSADVGMLDKFDRGLQTDVHVFVNFDYTMGRSIRSGVYDTYEGCKGGYLAKGTRNKVMIRAKDSSGVALSDGKVKSVALSDGKVK
nr:hypothetical protein [Tanacetum cinerariifolium]